MKKTLIHFIFISICGVISPVYPSGQLSNADQETLLIKTTVQIKLFQDYCGKIASKKEPDNLKDEYITTAAGLFDSMENTIDISSLYGTTEKRKIQTYLSRLKNLPYSQVEINSGTIELNRPFEYLYEKSEQTGDEWFETTVDVFQRFEARISGSHVYTDIIIRQFKVLAKKTDKTWIIFLGDIGAKQVNTASRIKDAKIFYDAGLKQIEDYKKLKKVKYTAQNNDEEQMYSALISAFLNFRNACLLNKKYIGLSLEQFEDCRTDYMFAGIHYYNQTDFLKAWQTFGLYIEIESLPEFTWNKNDVDEQNYVMAQYYAGLTLSQLELPEMTIILFEKIKDSEYMNYELYEQLAGLGYEKLGDTINQERILKEGYEKYPEAPYSLLRLIEFYSKTGKNDQAIQYLESEIKQNQSNPVLFFTMAKIYEYALNDLDNAEYYFLQALALKPDYTEAMSGIGRVYYNQAVDIWNKANQIFDPVIYGQEMDKAKDVMKKSLPYYEKVHAENPEDNEALIALRGIYYNLNMVDKFDDIDKKLQGLKN